MRKERKPSPVGSAHSRVEKSLLKAAKARQFTVRMQIRDTSLPLSASLKSETNSSPLLAVIRNLSIVELVKTAAGRHALANVVVSPMGRSHRLFYGCRCGWHEITTLPISPLCPKCGLNLEVIFWPPPKGIVAVWAEQIVGGGLACDDIEQKMVHDSWPEA